MNENENEDEEETFSLPMIWTNTAAYTQTHDGGQKCMVAVIIIYN
jgi:hypothetical protein